MKTAFLSIAALLLAAFVWGQTSVIPGAERMEVYIPLLKNKSVGVFANHTSLVRKKHLVDTLLKCGIRIQTIFGPEHGFRGDAGAGERVKDGVDAKTGLPVISLYGNHKKPTAEDLKGLDLLLFDIQDIGVRFYTYISSLQYFMEAALENNIPLIILDRPNPNGFYIDGPVLEKSESSFVGMQPVPVVYGMTIGEYAAMIAGEKWLSTVANSKLVSSKKTASCIQIIDCKNYTHKTLYELPIKTSPNLPDMSAVYIYPSTCFFEGTVVSEGRGTLKPFQYIGHPKLPSNMFAFTPVPTAAAKSSKHYYQQCYGWDLSDSKENILKKLNKQIQLTWLLEAYRLFPDKDTFFLKNNFFNKLSGNTKLMQQIKDGITEANIRKSWSKDIETFKAIRKKYLRYIDFE